MCGIITSLTKKPSLENVIKVKKQYKHQYQRGTDGFGFVAIQDNEIKFVRCVYEEEIMEELDKLGETTFLMFHHRIPTCNFNTPDANHPLFIHSKKNLEYKYFLVHNGSVTNTDSLRKEHETDGFKYKSEVEFVYGKSTYVNKDHTDSESLGIEMAKFIEGKQTRIKARGGVAMFMLQLDAKNNPVAFYYFRNSNPINWFSNQSSLFLASLAHGQTLPDNTLFMLDLKTWETFTKPARLSDYNDVGTTVHGEVSAWTKLERRPKVIDVKKNTLPTTADTLRESQAVCTIVPEKREGNTLFVPDRPAGFLGGFKRLFQDKPREHFVSPLRKSIRTMGELEKELAEHEELYYSFLGNLYSYEEHYGANGSETHTNLIKDVNDSKKILDDLKEEFDNLQNSSGHILKSIPV